MTVFDVIAYHARTWPEAPALITDGMTISYEMLIGEAMDRAGRLAALGIRPGALVGIALKDGPEFLIAALAAARIDAIAAPLDWRAPAAEIERLIGALELTVALIEPREGVSHPAAITLDDLRRTLARPIDSAVAVSQDSGFRIKITSGSTGSTKAIITTHRQQLHDWMRWLFDFGVVRHDCYLSATPLCYAAGFSRCVRHLLTGASVAMFPPLFSPEELVEAAGRMKATNVFAVPTIARQLLGVARGETPLLPNLHIIELAGAAFTAEEKLAALRKISPNTYDCYGASGYGQISILRPREMAERPETVGRATFGAEIEIVDEAGQPLPCGDVGRLRVRGPGLLNELPATAGQSATEFFDGGWYYPGDLARLDEAGFITLVGRSANLIKRGGASISSEEVEAVITRHPAVREAAVFGRPSADLGQEVVAVIVLRRAIGATELERHCRAQLAPHKVPVAFHAVETLPRNTAGKIARAKLPELTAGKGRAVV